MRNTTKIVAIATVMLAASAPAFYSNNGYGNSNLMSNFGPFGGGQNMGPFHGGSNMGPFRGTQNFGSFANNYNMNNDSDWGFKYNNKNSIKKTSNVTTDGQFADAASANAKAQVDAYFKGAADGFAKGQADAYAKGYADGKMTFSVDSRSQN